MSLTNTFDPAAAGVSPSPPAGRRTKKRDAPFSLRLSPEERARLSAEAAGAPLGAYIKAKVLGGTVPVRMRRTGLAPVDRTALAQALGMLGHSRIASNLNQLAYAANIGALPLDPETMADLLDAVEAVRDIRRLLLTALGLKADDGDALKPEGGR